MQELLKAQALDVEAVDVLGDTPLYTAVQYNAVAVANAKQLVSNGAQLRHRNAENGTILHEAVRYETLDTFRWILEGNLCDINATNTTWTRTALMYAIMNAPVDTFVIPLLNAGVLIFAMDNCSNKTEIIQLLLDAGADPSVPDAANS